MRPLSPLWALIVGALGTACSAAPPPPVAAPAPVAAVEVKCPTGSSWDGSYCVATEVKCPANLVWNGKDCDEPPGPPVVVSTCSTRSACEEQCDEGKAHSCTDLGIMYAGARGVPQNDPLAVELYIKACDKRDAEGCFQLGAMYENARGVPEDQEHATQIYRKACELQSASGCNNLGYLHATGQGVPKNITASAKLWPGWMISMTFSTPCAELMDSFTRPYTTRYSPSHKSPR